MSIERQVIEEILRRNDRDRDDLQVRSREVRAAIDQLLATEKALDDKRSDLVAEKIKLLEILEKAEGK